MKYLPHALLAVLTLVTGLTLMSPGAQAREGVVAPVIDHAVVFLYHRFGETRYPSTDVKVADFKAQLNYLATHGYHVWPLTRVVRYLKEDRHLPDKIVAITIDDAFESVYTVAYPLLKARGWPFTVFVSTEAVDRGFKGFMTWAQMRTMQAHGVTFANHTVDHAHLLKRLGDEDATSWRERVTRDIQQAQARLQHQLGKAPTLFAYPYGEYDTALADLVAELGYTAFGQQSGAIGRYSDLRALPRYPVAGPYASLQQFRTKAASLPLPVLDFSPSDPLRLDNVRPRLNITLGDAQGAHLKELSCYVSGQGKVPVIWQDKYTDFTVQAPRPLGVGRSRYNCTAPNRDRTRYYWFSQQWLVPPESWGLN